jgi:hypothetical protein
MPCLHNKLDSLFLLLYLLLGGGGEGEPRLLLVGGEPLSLLSFAGVHAWRRASHCMGCKVLTPRNVARYRTGGVSVAETQHLHDTRACVPTCCVGSQNVVCHILCTRCSSSSSLEVQVQVVHQVVNKLLACLAANAKVTNQAQKKKKTPFEDAGAARLRKNETSAGIRTPHSSAA